MLLSGYGLRGVAAFDGENGSYPQSGLLLAENGNLYGTTRGSGAAGAEIFEIPSGSNVITPLASLPNGIGPASPLTADSDGDLFGSIDSTNAVYELPVGADAVTALAIVSGASRSDPQGTLVVDSDGNVFGTAKTGGASNEGTLFEIPHGSGSAEALVSFNGASGSAPVGGLIADASGNLFGTTSQGGTNNDGTIFEFVKSTGTLTVLASFAGSADGSARRRTAAG